MLSFLNPKFENHNDQIVQDKNKCHQKELWNVLRSFYGQHVEANTRRNQRENKVKNEKHILIAAQIFVKYFLDSWIPYFKRHVI
jgi:hypothetical protein